MGSAFDSNAWYQLTESRVDFNSSLQVAGDGVVMAAAGTKTFQFWQIFWLGNNQYAFRNQVDGINKQLATCYAKSEIDPSRTQPCMQPALDDDSQKWTIQQWPDGSYRINNVGNGTGYNLDCHPGDPMFMSSTTAAVPNQPAQHWKFSSIGAINDGAYSTTITTPVSSSSQSSSSSPSSASASTTQGNPPTSSATTTSHTASATGAANTSSGSSGSGSSLSTNAAAGIGVGIGLFVCASVAAFLLLFLRRRRRVRSNNALVQELEGTHAPVIQEKFAKEAVANPRYEMAQPAAELAADDPETFHNNAG